MGTPSTFWCRDIFNYANWVRYRAESRIHKSNTKDSSILPLWRPTFGTRVRTSGPKFDIYFWFGLGLGYIMVCDVTLIFVQVRSVILIKELGAPAGRIGSRNKFSYSDRHNKHDNWTKNVKKHPTNKPRHAKNKIPISSLDLVHPLDHNSDSTHAHHLIEIINFFLVQIRFPQHDA